MWHSRRLTNQGTHCPEIWVFEDVAIVFHVLGFYLEQFVWLLFGVVVSVDVTHDSSPVYCSLICTNFTEILLR
jgi:hypothetical protein